MGNHELPPFKRTTMPRLTKTFKTWLPLAFVGTALAVLVFASVQHISRMDAYDPEIQMAEDTAAALQAGTTPLSLQMGEPVDMYASVAPFIITTDATKKVITSSTTLNGTVPVPPEGSFDSAKAKSGNADWRNENRITWQPQNNLRIATVIKYYGGAHPGYVIAGRNMREVENRIKDLALIAVADLIGLLVGSFLILCLTLRD
jgi:hypothetical protein